MEVQHRGSGLRGASPAIPLLDDCSAVSRVSGNVGSRSATGDHAHETLWQRRFDIRVG